MENMVPTMGESNTVARVCHIPDEQLLVLLNRIEALLKGIIAVPESLSIELGKVLWNASTEPLIFTRQIVSDFDRLRVRVCSCLATLLEALPSHLLSHIDGIFILLFGAYRKWYAESKSFTSVGESVNDISVAV